MPFPVPVFQQTLIELTRGMPRQFLFEIDRFWALNVRDIFAAKLDELCL